MAQPTKPAPKSNAAPTKPAPTAPSKPAAPTLPRTEAPTLATVLATLARIEASVAKLSANQPASSRGPVQPATDADLDSEYGNPEVRFNPNRWSGDDMKGQRYSDCPRDFLLMLAESLEFFADRNDEVGAVDSKGRPKSRWERLDASRARGWARRSDNA